MNSFKPVNNKKRYSILVFSLCLVLFLTGLQGFNAFGAVKSITGGSITGGTGGGADNGIQARIDSCKNRIETTEKDIQQIDADINSLKDQLNNLTLNKPKYPAKADKDQKEKYNKDMNAWLKQVDDINTMIGKKNQDLKARQDELNKLQYELKSLQAQYPHAETKDTKSK